MSKRNKAEWFDQQPLMTKRVGDTSYEIWANGTFACTAPNGDRFKHYDSAEDWLVERGITNDEQLRAIQNGEMEGWSCDMNRWFELIVFKVEDNRMTELYCGEPFFEWDEDYASTDIHEAIENDKEE